MEAIDGAMAELYRAMLADDVQALDELLADDVIYVRSAGAIEKKKSEFLGVQWTR